MTERVITQMVTAIISIALAAPVLVAITFYVHAAVSLVAWAWGQW